MLLPKVYGEKCAASLDCQYAEFLSLASDAVLCTVLVCKIMGIYSNNNILYRIIFSPLSSPQKQQECLFLYTIERSIA